MWDVKATNLTIDTHIAQEFYLNYVGCKELSFGVSNKLLYSFTLTMWDVKSTLDIV